MATNTTIARMPGDWAQWGGADAWPEAEARVQPAFDALLAAAFPGGHIVRVGNEIYGPATLRFGPAYDDARHCWRFQRDTPDVDEIAGVERLDDDEWLTDMVEAAWACATDEEE